MPFSCNLACTASVSYTHLESVATATDFLKAEDFYAEAHKEIFESMLDIYDHGDPVDLVTVTEQLRQRGTLEAVGGVAYISDLSMVCLLYTSRCV